MVRASRLQSGSRVGVVGGGPAGSFFAYFLLRMARMGGIGIDLDIFEPRDFSRRAPHGCNMCGGIVSETLVQNLAAEGITLPPTVVQRGIDSYVLHMDVGDARIETPLHEKRIAAVYRGAGPRDLEETTWRSFDAHLQDLAAAEGATIRQERVEDVLREDDRPAVVTRDGGHHRYDVLALAVGVNAGAAKFLERIQLDYDPPRTTKTFIREYRFGRDSVGRTVGSAMHVFLLNIPRLEFAAVIPKGDYATVCMLGDDIDKPLLSKFLHAPQVGACLPDSWEPDRGSCQCSPRINTWRAARPFADRVVFVGDCAVTRLYKDGIGAAYRTAKAAARTVAYHGVKAESFRRHYQPVCRRITRDNMVGMGTFAIVRQIQKARVARRALRRMVINEQAKPGRQRHMSQVMWDLFTGSASYTNVFWRTLHPGFLSGFVVNLLASIAGRGNSAEEGEAIMESGGLGASYGDGDVIVRQGEVGECMYVVQEGRVQVVLERDGGEVPLRELGPGEVIGEMALFDREVRSATVRAVGEARVLTLDRHNFMSRISEDPTLAFHIVETMSRRIRDLSDEVARLQDAEHVRSK